MVGASANNEIQKDFRPTPWQKCYLKDECGWDTANLKDEEIGKKIRNGVRSKDNKMMYKADENNNNCFTIFAKGLQIDNSGNWKHCQWSTERDGIEVAQVTNLTWLKVQGSFGTEELSRNIGYKVSFLLKPAAHSSMSGQPVQLKLTIGNRTIVEKEATLPGNPSQHHGTWYELEVGKFKGTSENVGTMTVTMWKEFQQEKTGLIIKGVEIKPE